MKSKCLMLVAVLLLSQVIIEVHDDSVSVTAAQDVEANVPPVVEILPDVSRGMAPLIVHFDGDLYDEDGEVLSLEWDFEGDGVFEFLKDVENVERSQRLQALKLGLQREHIYSNPGIYHAVARVTDDKGESTVSSVTIQVHSDRPYLDITPCDTEFDYMAQAGYEAFFKSGITDSESVRFQMGNYWISYQWENQLFGEIGKVKGVPEGNKIWYKNVFSNVDIRYTVQNDLLLEELIVNQFMPLTVIEQSFQIHGVKYRMEEDGSIRFYNGEDLVFSIPRPVMYEFGNPENKSYGLHYEIIERGNDYLLRKIIDDFSWLQKASYPVVIDSSTQGEIADPWEQQGLTPYGQYFKNLNEYVDPLTGHLTIRHTDYSLSGRGLDLAVTRVYSTVVAYKEEEDGSGEYVPVSTYIEAPTDLGYGWSLDFPWMEVENNNPGEYMHLPNGGQVQINFQNGVWNCPSHEFIVYDNPDNTYTKYQKNGVKEEYDSEGRLTSITDLNGNTIVFTYGQYGISSITDTVGRVLTFSYSGGKLMSISDGIKTVSCGYSGDKLVSVTDPIGRVTVYEYLSGSSFIITGVTYPTGGFSSYQYATIVPEFARIAPYKSSESEDGQTKYYIYKVDSPDTVEWTSPQDIASVLGGGRPCVFQRDDGSLVMYYRDTYIWTEENCYWDHDMWVCETITHTEYWIKRSVSFDQHHWSTPQNVLQVKSTTGNPVVIEKQNGTFIMYYKDKYVWTEEHCEFDRRLKEWVCETITHIELNIYRRTSTDGLVWGSPVKIQQTATGIRNIAAIQKHDSNFLMCYTDKVGSSYYIRQKTSSDGVTWSSPSTIVQVNSGTGNPALLQANSGTIYLAYRKGNNYIYVLSNSGSGWSSPVQTTGVSNGDPALLESDSEVVIIYKGTDEYCYRISSSDGTTWSVPSQIAPNKALTDPATVDRKDVFYRVTSQQISASAFETVRITEFSYGGDDYLARSTDVLISEDQTLKSSMHFGYDSKGRVVERIARDENGTQTEKIIYTYNNKNKVIRQDVYAGTSTDISYSVITAYDNKGNVIYTKGPEGAEHYYSYANTDCENQFTDSKGLQVSLFTDSFYTNSVPSQCHNLIVGEAYINNGKATETYYQYDTNGNFTETKTLFPTRDYVVFSGTFDENGQTTFNFDLTGLTVTNGILVISSIAVPTQETLHETHSEVGNGWLNSGTWDEENFMADYLRCVTGDDPPDCWDGETEIGPFKHYPGTPHYTGYTTWIDGNTQYVQTDYLAVVNEYPEEVQYKLNNGSWTIITDNLGSGTTSITIPSSEFIQGVNTLYFQESNTYQTKFDWTLYIDQGSIPEVYVNSLAYDAYGNITSITDALSNTTILSYDQSHTLLTSVTNALNQTLTATYDFNTGWLTSMTDAKGNITSFEYDIIGRVTKKINPDLTQSEAIYDDQNNTVTVYDELDHYILYDYDCLGRLLKIEYYLSPTEMLTERYTYNYQYKVKTMASPGGHTYSYEYDSLGRPTKVYNPDSTYKEIQYNDTANIVTVFDENQHKKEYHHNWLGNLLWVKEYTDLQNYYLTQYMYDDLGNMTFFTDANGNTTSYDYDSLFGLTQVTYPDSTIETFSYDALGNVLQKTDPKGTISFDYNSIYQLVEVSYPDLTSISFEYDANGNHTLMVDSAGQTSYDYDNRNRCISETRTIGCEQYTVNYTYDAASRLISTLYPDQSIITYEYDSLNRLVNIPGYAQFSYNADSLLVTMTYISGVVTTYQHDSRGSVTNMHAEKNGTDILAMNYQYDHVGNITQLDCNKRLPDQTWAESTEIFTYDWLDRLLSAQGNYGSLSYSYDPVGNRLSRNDLLYTYNEMNELISISDGETFVYDQNGNRTQKTNGSDTWIYMYDSANRLTKIEKNDTVEGEYVYDGSGNRIQVTEESTTTTYIYAGLNLLYEENTTGTATYIYGPIGRIAKRTNVEGEIHTFYYHTDHLGSTRSVTGESGNVIAVAEYQPFGETSTIGEESYLYNGKEKDASGLYYYGARYYDPDVGRFITRDPLSGEKAHPQSLNRYAYCLNNPVKLVDVAGMRAVKMCNVDTGICTYETVNGWAAHDENGNELSSSEIQQKIDEGDYVGAVKLILEFLGYEITGEGTVTERIGGDEIEVDYVDVCIGDKTVHIRIYDPSDMGILSPGATRNNHPIGKTSPNTSFFMKAIVQIYFFDDVNMTVGELFHTVGHEMVHAEHHATGRFHEWTTEWNWLAAVNYSEYLAYEWNLEHLYIIDFPGAQERFRFYMEWYIREFFRVINR